MSKLKPATEVCYFLSLLFQEDFNLEQIDFEYFEFLNRALILLQVIILRKWEKILKESFFFRIRKS